MKSRNRGESVSEQVLTLGFRRKSYRDHAYDFQDE